MSQPNGPDPIELYKRILADVKSAGVTDPHQAEELADRISLDLLEDFHPTPDGQTGNGSAPSDEALEQLRAIAEGLREERDRLEWTAAQVAHLVHGRGKPGGPSIDPDPTPPEPISLTKSPSEESSADAPSPDAAGNSPTAATSQPPAPAPTPSAAAPTSSSNGSSADQAPNQAVAPTPGIPERLPIRRAYQRRRLRKISALLCILILVTATVMLLSTAAG